MKPLCLLTIASTVKRKKKRVCTHRILLPLMPHFEADPMLKRIRAKAPTHVKIQFANLCWQIQVFCVNVRL